LGISGRGNLLARVGVQDSIGLGHSRLASEEWDGIGKWSTKLVGSRHGQHGQWGSVLSQRSVSIHSIDSDIHIVVVHNSVDSGILLDVKVRVFHVDVQEVIDVFLLISHENLKKINVLKVGS
jgi:hypothetical protein